MSDVLVGRIGRATDGIEPGQIGEVERGVRMAMEYARRIDRGNLKPGALDRLVNGYSSHDFVIDREEARDLFQRVRPPSPDEAELLTFVEPIMADRRNEGRFLYLDEVLGADASGGGASAVTDEDGAPAAGGEAPSPGDASAGEAAGGEGAAGATGDPATNGEEAR